MPDLADLRNSTNETARVARGSLWLLLTFGLFLGILLYGTDDMALLTRNEVVAPLMQVTVPVELLFGLGPVLFVLLHLNLLVRLNRLHHVSERLRASIKEERGSGEWAKETALLFPFDFLQLLFYRMGRDPVPPGPDPDCVGEPRRWPRRWLADLRERTRREHAENGYLAFMFVLVFVPVAVFPLCLLVAVQMRLLPYQSEALTLVHQACVTTDLVIVYLFAVLLDPVRRFMATVFKGGWLERAAYGSYCLYALTVFVACLLFVWFVAVVPGSPLERQRPFPGAAGLVSVMAFGDWWSGDGCSRRGHGKPSFFKRYMHVVDRTVAAGRRDGAVVAAYLAKGEDPELAWQFVDELDLGGRSFRYAWFDRSGFRQASFRGSDLKCARFKGALLRRANLEGAAAQGTEFGSADLTDARLDHGGFEDVSFRGARLDGASAAGAKFSGSDFREASLHGTDLTNSTIEATGHR